jgi:hypothetical protein
MPPAFVLSQDQTLKFIPGPNPRNPAAPVSPAAAETASQKDKAHRARKPGPSIKGLQNARSDARTFQSAQRIDLQNRHRQALPPSRHRPAIDTPAAARASLPIFHNLKQHIPNREPSLKGPRLYPPPHPPSTHLMRPTQKNMTFVARSRRFTSPMTHPISRKLAGCPEPDAFPPSTYGEHPKPHSAAHTAAAP